MPSAPPNSELVSEIAEAAPARSCGAVPTIRSVGERETGAMPSETIDRAGDDDRKAGAVADLRQEDEADRGENEAAGHDERRANPLREDRRQSASRR